MERAKRIATALLGVAFTASCCEPTNAQSPHRFIRQPAKVTEPAESSPATSTLAALAPVAPNPTVQAAPANRFDESKERFNTVVVEPKSVDQKLSFPALSDPAGLQFDLKWTSRNDSQSRSPSRNANAASQPQFNTNSLSNHSTPTPSTQYSLHSKTTSKQQPDSTSEVLNQIAIRVEAIESHYEKEIEPVRHDRIRASLVSARITNDPRFANASAVQPLVTRIEAPQGWQAIQTRLSDHITKCESLLRRGAFCSAREEAEMACMLLFRHIDLHDNVFRCEPAMQTANQALREAEDFVVAMRSTADEESLRRLVNAHKTPVLKQKNLSDMSPLAAAQHYRQFAESQLAEAAQGHPWASELLYTVGRTYQAEADAANNDLDVLRMKAMAYYRASRTTMPSNAIACNQLGYLLLQMDRNEEAREALFAAVEMNPGEASLSNLAEASRRLGDVQTTAWATQSVAAIRSRTPPASPVPAVVELSQEEFTAISPRAIGPKNPIESGPNTSPNRSANVTNANQLR